MYGRVEERPKRSWSIPRKYWLRSRWPELETGRNSVRPLHHA